MQIVHIINPVKVTSSSDLHVAQPITFESMRVAKEVAEQQDAELQINLISTQYAEDHEIIPDYIYKTTDLERSVLDLGSFRKPRKLPLLKDILDQLIEVATDTDYYIYTNVDIALMPHFYLSVKRIIEEGYDAFVINRRTIPEKHTTIDDLPFMYAEIGKQHQGYDCFVFKRELQKKIILKNITIGVPKVGLSLFLNLYCNSKLFKIFDQHHLTFHIGDDRIWKKNHFNDLCSFNSHQYELITRELPLNKLKTGLEYHQSTLKKNGFLKTDQSHSTQLWKSLISRFNRLSG